MRTSLVRECVRVGNRIWKVLEDPNLKLDSVTSDALGVSGRAMIMALVQGCQDPVELAQLVQGRLRARPPELGKALAGQVTPHHRFLLRDFMRQLAFPERQGECFQKQIERHISPFEWAAELLVTAKLDRERFQQTLVRCLEKLGRKVILQPAASAGQAGAGLPFRGNGV